jgi:hypothetical protein
MAPPTDPSFKMFHRIADEVLDTVMEAPDGASERGMLSAFEARGVGAEVFYGVVAALEEAGLVRCRGCLLYRALLN